MTTVQFRYGFHPEGMDPLFVLRHGARTLPSSPRPTVLAAAPVQVPASAQGRSHLPLPAPAAGHRRVGAYLLSAAVVLGAAIGVWVLAFGQFGSSDEASEPLLAWAPPVTLEPDPLPAPVVHEAYPDVGSTLSSPSRSASPMAPRPSAPSRATTPAAVDPAPPASPPPPATPASPPAGPTHPPADSASKPTLPALTVPEVSSPRVMPERAKPAALPGLSSTDLVHREGGANESKPEAVAKPRAPAFDRLPTPQPKTRLTVPRVSR